MATRIKKITIGTPITSPAATFLEFDSSNVAAMVDSAYVQARQVDLQRDSAYVTNIIDSGYIQSKQNSFLLSYTSGDTTTISGNLIPSTDSTYNLGSPTNKFKEIYLSGNTINLGNLLLKADGDTLLVQKASDQSPATLDAINYTDQDVLNLIDSGYVQSRQAGLDSQGTTISFRKILIDSENGTALIADIVGDEFIVVSGDGISVTGNADSTSFNISVDGTVARLGNDISLFVNDVNYFKDSDVRVLVDSNYVQSKQLLNTYSDSNVNQLIDSAYVQARQTTADSAFIQSFGYAELGVDVSVFVNDANYLDSNSVAFVIDSAYVNSKVVIPPGYGDSDVSLFVDSAYVQARQTLRDSAYIQSFGYAELGVDITEFINDANYLDSTTGTTVITSVVDSAYVQARQDLRDSSFVNNIILEYGYSTFDSTNASFLVDSAYILNRLTSTELRDKASVTPFANTTFGPSGATVGIVGDFNIITHKDGVIDQGAMDTYIFGDLKPFTVPVLEAINPSAFPETGDGRSLGANDFRWDKAYIETLYVGNIKPHTDGIYDIGESNNRFKTGYLTANTLDLGGLLISAVEDEETGEVGLAVTDDPTVPPVSVPNQNQVVATTAQVIATSSKLQDMSNVNDSPYSGNTLMYDGNNFIWVDYKTQSEIRQMISNGTGVSYNNGTGVISIGQAVGTSDNVTFNNLTLTGNLQVDGTQTIVNTTNLEVADNMLYLNGAESAGSPTQTIDIGIAANYNDQGSYAHTGVFRDASDQTWKFYDNYTPEPDDASQINTGHASFKLASLAAKDFTGKYVGFDSDFAAATTDDLSEGTNQYYTDARARAAVSASGDISYDSSTGVFSYTQPTNVSTFSNDANYLVSSDIPTIVDSAYVEARTPQGVTYDDNDVIALVDSAYVAARVDVQNVDSDTIINATHAYGYSAANDKTYVLANTNPGAEGWDYWYSTSGGIYQNSGGILSQIYNPFLGSYDSLSDKPTLFNGSYDSLSDKPTLFNGTYDSLDGAPNVLDSATIYDTILTKSNIEAKSYTLNTSGAAAVNSFGVGSPDDYSGDFSGLSFSTGYWFDFETGNRYKKSSGTWSSLGGGGIDSAAITDLIDSAYINNRVTTPNFASTDDIAILRDTNGNPTLNTGIGALEVRALIGAGTSNFDGQFSSLTNVPTILDSAAAIATIEADGFGRIDSAQVAGIIDSAYIIARQTTYETAAIYVNGITPALAQFISANEVRDLIGAVDSAYVLANSSNDSAIQQLVDSAYVQARQDYAYSSITGGPTNLSEFTNGPGYITSSNLDDFEITSYTYTVTGATQSTFSGNDDNGNTLAYVAGEIMVYVNGVKIIETDDFTASNGSSVVLEEVAETGDVIEIVKYTGQVLTSSTYISISALKAIVASSTDFLDFKSNVANL